MLSLVVALALTCGTERWDVKVLQDADAAKVDVKSYSGTNVETLRELPAPGGWSNTQPRQPSERIVYRVDALLIGAKVEDDGDLHVVIADRGQPSHTMIVELPSGECLSNTHLEITARILEARKLLLSKMRLSAKFKKLPKPVPIVVTGVLFFDKPHGQTGLAPNAVELHPVLDLEFSSAKGMQPGTPDWSPASTSTHRSP